MACGGSTSVEPRRPASEGDLSGYSA
jgi:hypothetical protein